MGIGTREILILGPNPKVEVCWSGDSYKALTSLCLIYEQYTGQFKLEHSFILERSLNVVYIGQKKRPKYMQMDILLMNINFHWFHIPSVGSIDQ